MENRESQSKGYLIRANVMAVTLGETLASLANILEKEFGQQGASINELRGKYSSAMETLKEKDKEIGKLKEQIREAGLPSISNVVVVDADHSRVS